MNSTPQTKSKKIWRSVADYEGSPEFLATLEKEFPSGAQELSIKPGMERRKFLELIGASVALAGVMSTGCIRRPKEYIYPENNRPENTLPGVLKYYSTAARIGSNVLGLSVTSTDGRPTKIDGNYRHVMSNPIKNSKLGSSNAFAQAEILNLYDADRGQECISQNPDVPAKKSSILQKLYQILQSSHLGEAVGVLVESIASPAYYNLLEKLKKTYPKITIAEINTFYNDNSKKAATRYMGQAAQVSYNLIKSDVILALDADFLGVEGQTVKYAREFSERRKQVDTTHEMNRLYSIESNLSVTGSNADHRYALSSSQIPNVIVALAKELKKQGINIPSKLVSGTTPIFEARLNKWIVAVAKDLLTHKNRSVIIVGEKQPEWVHFLAFVINNTIGALDSIVQFTKDQTPSYIKTPESFLGIQKKKPYKTLVMLGQNPAYSLSNSLHFKNLITETENSFYLGYHKDETAQASTYYIPSTHFLESWGDTLASDGTYSIRQPLIAPLFDEAMNEYELIASLFEKTPKTAYETVRAYYQENSKQFSSDAVTSEDAWRTALSTGFVGKINLNISNVATGHVDECMKSYEAHVVKYAKPEHFELVFALSNTIYDGRYANNAWMQELPDPISKLVWDNALLVSPKTGKKLKLSGNPKPGKTMVDMVTIHYQNRTLEIPVWEVPGIANDTGVLSLGYGSQIGQVAKRAGFNAQEIQTPDVWFDQVKIEKSGNTYSLVSTQEHGSMIGDPAADPKRTPAVRTASLAEYRTDPKFVLKDEVIPLADQKSFLYEFPKDPAQSKWARQQWGMSIDLNSCIGCNACTIACQAENNISVVGKEEVHVDRVMHWIRLDRYFTGDVHDPEVQTLFQPLNCQQCENAPCEAVCPVVATAHSPDGLNEMTYNRCVGTRYCANNCPYKVRRFNFFNYSEENDKKNSLYALQKNPNVTVRFRGVMEKCTYCVHKINTAKNKSDSGIVKDGDVLTACQSVCPTNAIVFGDIADAATSVSKHKAIPRNYGLLGELNTRPRTTYLAKIRNVNPEIG